MFLVGIASSFLVLTELFIHITFLCDACHDADSNQAYGPGSVIDIDMGNAVAIISTIVVNKKMKKKIVEKVLEEMKKNREMQVSNNVEMW